MEVVLQLSLLTSITFNIVRNPIPELMINSRYAGRLFFAAITKSSIFIKPNWSCP
ncbi:MAG: hypothetical protein ACI9DJ_003414 [Algoriphagus sp.]|jgi:hypothetical protein